MTMDDRHEGLGQMLRKAGTKSVPPELHAEIMQKIRVLENRRVYRRLSNSTFAIRFVADSAAYWPSLINFFLLKIPELGADGGNSTIPRKALIQLASGCSIITYYILALYRVPCALPGDQLQTRTNTRMLMFRT